MSQESTKSSQESKKIAYILGIKKVYKTNQPAFVKSKSVENIIDTDNLFSILKILFCNVQKNNDILKEILNKKDNKFQDSMKKEAVRLEFAEKREKYKKHMRQSTSMTSDRTISGKEKKKS